MATITTQERNELTGLFIALFDAAPGADYLSDIVAAREAGASLLSIANALASKPEFSEVYPAFLTAQEFAQRAVDNLLTSTTPAGAQTWAKNWIVGKLNAGQTPANVLLQAAQALMQTPNTNYASAKTQMLNRIDVANYYSVVQEQPSGDVATLQAVLDGVDATAASVTAAKARIDNNLEGDEFTLTVGADKFSGTTGNDEFLALNVGTDGKAATTLSAFDELDGGKGIDTLNIYSDGVDNVGVGANSVIKNIEIVNLNNTGAGFGAVDASVFQGATEIHQIGVASAISKLGEGTTAGFKNIVATPITVTAAAAATAATVALSNVDDGSSLTVSGTATGKLASVTVAGAVVDGADAGAAVNAIALSITVGKDVQTLTLNTAVASTLTVTANGKAVTTVNAAASTGAIDYVAAGAVANITTGEGKDSVTLQTILNGTVKSASLNTGKGDDTIVVAVDDTAATADATVTVEAGEGNDSITVQPADVKLVIKAGAGDDTVKLGAIDAVTEDDVIDGGEGTDILVADGKTLVAEDYILLDEVIVGFEGVRFENTAASVDASRMSSYKIIEFHDAAGIATGVANDQKLFASVDLDATSAGYKAGPPVVYAGTLDITSQLEVGAGNTVTAKADAVILNVTVTSNKDGAQDYETTVLEGDVKTATVVLNSAVDTTGSILDSGALVVDTSATLSKLATLTISGNGAADVISTTGKALTTIDASGLNSVDGAGKAAAGLSFATDNTAVETIKLGGGLDSVSLAQSTVKFTDTITGLTLVDDTALAGKQVDATKSDALEVWSNDSSLQLSAFVKTAITAGSLNLALVAAAASTDGDKLVFTYAGNTYIYGDLDAAGAAGNGIVDDTDILIKLTGVIDLDLLVDAIG